MAEPSADRVVRGGPARGLEEIGGLGAGGPCFCQGFGEREAAQREEELVRFYPGLVLWRVGWACDRPGPTAPRPFPRGAQVTNFPGGHAISVNIYPSEMTVG